MLRIQYDLTVSNYFLDNTALTFDLHVAIEGLVFTEGVPTTGEHTTLADGIQLWLIMEHRVIYKIEDNRLIVLAVAPVA